MDITCFDDIITDNLIVNIDINNPNNITITGDTITVESSYSWYNGYSCDCLLHDMGLTSFDIGHVDSMEDKKQLVVENNNLFLQNVGKCIVTNPTEYDYFPYSGVTSYDDYNIVLVDDTETDTKYLDLSGGYLSGFFKLTDYNYHVLPERYPKGITIENVLYIKPESKGIFLFLGARAEDKYIPYFSGETTVNNENIEGVYTFENEYLHGFTEKEVLNDSFRQYEDMKSTVLEEESNEKNIYNNIISFGLSEDKKLFYKYIDGQGRIKITFSNNTISYTGLTLVSIVYKPDEIFDSIEEVECVKRRLGLLSFYVNGRLFWEVEEFPEFYFFGFNNHRTKQQGVPFTINWGGGSFGLKHSFHYDIKERVLYENQQDDYICENFSITGDIN